MKQLVTRRDEARGLRLAASQPESADEFLAFFEELRERIVAAVLEEDRVRSRLKGRRFAVLGADYREDKAEDREQAPRLAEIGFYDYEEDVLVVAVVDPRAGELLDLDERRGVSPPITGEELNAAKTLARRAGSPVRSPRIVAFPTPSYRLDERRAYHRCCTLYVPATPRAANVGEIVVDLSAQEVVPDDELKPEPPNTGELDPNEGRP